MRKITIMGNAIFFMNENEAYPTPDRDAGASFAVWHDEDDQYWLEVHYQREWRPLFTKPLASMEEVIEAVQKYDFETPPMKR